MTDITNTPPVELPTSPEYQFAYVLATIHSTYLLGDMDRVKALLENLPMALMDPKVNEIYLSDEVTEYLEWAYPYLFGEDDAEAAEEVVEDEEEVKVHPGMTEDEAEEFLAALWERLFGSDPDAFKAPELRDGVCGNPDCVCAPTVDETDEDEFAFSWEQDDDDDREELLAETDEFVIVKIWK